MALKAEKQAMELKVQNMRRQEQEATNNGYGIIMGKRLMGNKWYHKGYGLNNLNCMRAPRHIKDKHLNANFLQIQV